MAPSRINFKQEEPAKIPRPLNSFMIFRIEKQQEIVQQCPGANHRDMSKIISKWWRELAPEKKQDYIDQSERLRVEHRRLYPNYKFAPKKRASAARPYKKRPDTELIARDFDNKQRLLSFYHHGKYIDASEKKTLVNYIENTKSAKKSNTKSRKSDPDSGIISFKCSPPSPGPATYQPVEDSSIFSSNSLFFPEDAASSPSSFSLLSHHSIYSPSMASDSSNNGPYSVLLQDFNDPTSSYLVNYTAAFSMTNTITAADCSMNQPFSSYSTAANPIFDNGSLMMPYAGNNSYMPPLFYDQQQQGEYPSAFAQLLTQPFLYN